MQSDGRAVRHAGAKEALRGLQAAPSRHAGGGSRRCRCGRACWGSREWSRGAQQRGGTGQRGVLGGAPGGRSRAERRSARQWRRRLAVPHQGRLPASLPATARGGGGEHTTCGGWAAAACPASSSRFPALTCEMHTAYSPTAGIHRQICKPPATAACEVAETVVPSRDLLNIAIDRLNSMSSIDLCVLALGNALPQRPPTSLCRP